MTPYLSTLTLAQLTALGLEELAFLLLNDPESTNTLNSTTTSLPTRRGRLGGGGNPSRFIELTGGEEVPMIYYEPDAKTARSSYYYNTRLNKLFKRIIGLHPLTHKKVYYWQNVTEC
jgi:hypothetical protein